MHDSRRRGLHTYRLVLGDDGEGAAQIIEFEAAGAEAALMAAQRMCAGREAEVLQDGRSLGRVQNQAVGGFWILNGAPRADDDGARSGGAPSGGARSSGARPMADGAGRRTPGEPRRTDGAARPSAASHLGGSAGGAMALLAGLSAAGVPIVQK